jgi:penicillin-binding protein 1C
MQLARQLEPHPRNLRGKIGEFIDAWRIERAASKPAILEQYLNRVYYGGGAFGVEAAARHYFGKSAAALSDGEATLLAVLPRAPQRYDLETALPDALVRRAHVLGLMEARGWIDEAEKQRIAAQPIAIAVGAGQSTVSSGPVSVPRDAPHFTDWVLAQLRPETRARGGTIRTTLDLGLQRRLENVVRAHLAARATPGLQAGVVVIDPADGSVRALVGSADAASAEGGQIDIVTARRHPGSALKPFIYALALERGETPASPAHDTLAGVPAFRPHHRVHEHGEASFRDALAGSYNLAAVDVLGRVGTPVALETLRLAGLGPLPGTAGDYGLDLALGAPRVRLVDLAAAYSFLVDGGAVVRARVLADAAVWPAPQIFTPEASWLTMHVLADAQARRATFGADLPLDLPFPVAAKTGTSSGFADTVAVGATREAIAAAWTGAFDGSGTKGALAMWSAAPLVRAALLAVADQRGAPLTLPPAPDGVVTRTICRATGRLAGPACPSHREQFARGTEPTATCAEHHGSTSE